MATIQAINVSNLTVANVLAVELTSNFYVNPLLGVAAALHEVPQGKSQNRHISISTFTSAAMAENAAVTGSAIPTLDVDSSTLASVGVAYEMTSEAYNATENIGDLLKILEARAMESIADFVASDSSVGIAALAASLTAYGTSGAALTFNTIRLASRAICDAAGHNELICILDKKGIQDIARDLESSGASNYANQAMSPLIQAMFVDGAMPNNVGFTGIVYEGVNFFVVNRGNTQLYTTGGDTYGILTIPPPGMQTPGREVKAPIVLDYRANPAAASEQMKSREVENTTLMGTIPVGIFKSEPATSGADTFKKTFKVTCDSLLANAPGAAAIRYLS